MPSQISPEREIRYMLRARNTLIWVTTSEERRAERAIAAVASRGGYAVRYWDCATGATDMEGETVDIGSNPPPVVPAAAIKAIRARTERELWILRDLPPWLQDNMIARGLKSLARDLEDEVDPTKLGAVVVLTSEASVPDSLRGSTIVLDWPLPNREEIGRILDDAVTTSGSSINGDRDSVIDAAAGLAAADIAGALARSMVEYGHVDPTVIAGDKKRIIDRERVLTWFEPDPRGLEAVGGLDLLKDWLLERRMALSAEAREYGLQAPKGVLLLGHPGGGKSLVAKAVPSAWGVPLLRLDLGALRSKYVGESETNIRKALKVAEAVAPVVLWLDEIEKSLSSGNGRSDGGVSADALGTILTWMQEHEGEVFVVATANDVSALPPELTRKGRFDEIFFIDLPSEAERLQILEKTLEKFAQDAGRFDLSGSVIGRKTDGFSGAEVAELVPTGMFRSFADNKRPLELEDLLTAAGKTIPLSVSSKEKLDETRTWAESRARAASTKEAKNKGAAIRKSLARKIDTGEDTA